MNILKFVLIGIVGVYLLVILCGCAFFDKMAFPYPKCQYDKNMPNLFFIKDYLACVHLKNANNKYTIIYSHGNGEDLSRIYPLLELYVANGFNVLAYDYSGYGLSKGKPSEEQIYKNVEDVYDYAVNTLNIDSKNIVVAGFSMGSAATSYLSEKHAGDFAGTIIIGGFSSAIKAVLPVNIFPFNFLENIKRMPNVKGKFLFIHGTADRIVPYRNAIEMYNACALTDKKLVTIKDAAHNDLFWYDQSQFWKAINDFKNSLGEPKKLENN